MDMHATDAKMEEVASAFTIKVQGSNGMTPRGMSPTNTLYG